MKSKIKRGKGFGGTVRYIRDEGAKATGDKGAVTLSTNMIGRNAKELTKEFHQVRNLRPDIEKAVWHISLSLAEGETLSNENWGVVIERYLELMELDTNNHQYTSSKHTDTDNEHAHIVANRVGFDGKVFLGRKDVFKSIKATNQLEKEFNLKITPTLEEVDKYGNVVKRKPARKSKPKGNEIQKAARTGEEIPRIYIQGAIDSVLKNGKVSIKSYTAQLAAMGVTVRPNPNKKGEMKGLSYLYKGVAYSGTKLGADYNWAKKLSKVVEFDPKRDLEWSFKQKALATNKGDQEQNHHDDTFKFVKVKRADGTYEEVVKNQAQRAYWCIYNAEVSPEIARHAVIHKKGEQVIIKLDKGDVQIVDKGDSLLLREYNNMDEGIKAMIETAKAKGMNLSTLQPFGSEEFKQKARAALDKAVAEEKKLKMKNNGKDSTSTAADKPSLDQGQEPTRRKETSAPSQAEARATESPTSPSPDQGSSAPNTVGGRGSKELQPNGKNNGHDNRERSMPKRQPQEEQQQGDRVSRDLSEQGKPIWTRTGKGVPPSKEADRRVRAGRNQGAKGVQDRSKSVENLNKINADLDKRLANGRNSNADSSNPNFKSSVATAKPVVEHSRALKQKQKLWDKQSNLIPAERYDITLQHDKHPTIVKSGLTKDEVTEHLGFFSSCNAKGYNVFVTPISTKDDFIVVDDIDNLDEFKAKGYQPCLIQETSKDSIQAVLRIPSKHSFITETQSQELNKRFTQVLNKKRGDKGVGTNKQPFRLVGFNNKKAKRNNEYTKIIGGDGGYCDHSINNIIKPQIARHLQGKKNEIAKQEPVKQAPKAAPPKATKSQKTSPERDFERLRNRHAGVMKKHGVGIDDSALDYNACKFMFDELNYGRDDFEDMANAILIKSPNINERHPNNAKEYADRTVEAAFEGIPPLDNDLKSTNKRKPRTPKI